MKAFTQLMTAAVAALLTVTPAVAADKVIKSFDEQTLKNVIAAVGVKETETGGTGDDKFTVFTIDGVKYVTALRGCKSEGCYGIMIQCSFRGATFSPTTSNSFNLKYTYTTSAVSEDRQELRLGRVITAAGGVTEAHATESFKAFFEFPALLVEQYKKDSSMPVASASPQAVPVAVSAATSDALAKQTQPLAEKGLLPVSEKFSNQIAP